MAPELGPNKFQERLSGASRMHETLLAADVPADPAGGGLQRSLHPVVGGERLDHGRWRNSPISNKCIAVRKVATLLRELTCHMGSHSVTCHPAEVTFPPLTQPELVLD